MKIDRVLEKIAMQNGVSVAEVRSEIQHAIDEGIKNPEAGFMIAAVQNIALQPPILYLIHIKGG